MDSQCGSHDRRTAVVFAVFAAAHLVPIWAFRYIPTQDGPSHLSNAVLVMEYGKPGTRYAEVAQISYQQVPNLTAQVLLVGLMRVVPPLLAEKLLASLYVSGLAWALWRFFAAASTASLPLAPLALTSMYSFCFWMGFFNYCLSLILFWVIVGSCIRWRRSFTGRQALTLAVVLCVTYFTHLMGFVLALAAVFWFLALTPRPRLAQVLWVLAAGLPALYLCLAYFARTGLFEQAGRDVLWQAATVIREAMTAKAVWSWVQGLHLHWFGAHEPQAAPVTILAVLLYDALIISTLAGYPAAQTPSGAAGCRWAIGLFALCVAAASAVCPDFLGEHGGYTRCRLTLLPPVLALSLLRAPSNRRAAAALTTAICLVVSLNLALVLRHASTAAGKVEEFTAAATQIGHGRVLAVAPRRLAQSAPDPVLHASGYYCLTGGNVTLDNYEATKRYFPVRFRGLAAQNLPSDFGDWRSEVIDVLIVWDTHELPSGFLPGRYREVFHQGRLRVFGRTEEPAARPLP